MAAIDSLLRLIDSQQAEVLKLVPEAAPVLLVGGEERPLSMPPVAREMVEAFVAEMRPADIEAGESSFGYQAEDIGAFKVQIRELDGQLSAVVIVNKERRSPARPWPPGLALLRRPLPPRWKSPRDRAPLATKQPPRL